MTNIKDLDLVAFEREVRENGYFSAELVFKDGSNVFAKVFEIENGILFGKEYSGCEFYVPVSEIVSFEEN